jgi:hypothetical protein
LSNFSKNEQNLKKTRKNAKSKIFCIKTYKTSNFDK